MSKAIIQVNGEAETLQRLEMFKKHSRESHNETSDNLLDKEEIHKIQLVLNDIRQGKTTPIEQVAKDLGVILR